MRGLFKRDYSILTDDELEEKKKIDAEGIRVTGARFGRKNFVHKYSRAIRHYVSLFPNNYMDNFLLKDEIYLETICDEFEMKLNSNESLNELDIKRFIQDNEYYHIPASIFSQYRFGHHGAYVFKEFQLGADYRADYLLIGKASGGYHFIFVEFETPSKSVTLSDGSFGEGIRKGINQIYDWRYFLQSNFSIISSELKKYTFQKLPDEMYSYDETRMFYVIVSGRRKDYTEKTYRLRRELDQNNKIKLLHYDNLLDEARKLIGAQTY